MSKLSEIVNAQSSLSGVTRIGSLIWWDLASGLDISHDELVDKAKLMGVSDRFLPSEISPISAFKRAANTTRSQIASQDLLLRKIADDRDKLVLGLVHEDKQAKSKSLKYHQRSTITFFKDRGTISNEHNDWSYQNENAQVYDKICLEFKESLKLKTDDIRRILTSFAKSCTISLRDAGGVYFVPIAYESELNAIASLISCLNSKNIVYIKPEYIASDKDRQTLQRVGQNSLTEEIQNLEQDLDELLAENKQRDSSLTRRLQRYRETREKVETISQQLQFQADGLFQKLDLLTARLKGDVNAIATVPAKSDVGTRSVLLSQPNTNTNPVVSQIFQSLDW